jgi:uncharacterized protein (DUF427 family)
LVLLVSVCGRLRQIGERALQPLDVPHGCKLAVVSGAPSKLERARAKWRYIGKQRPDFAIAPEAGQESVWDYPRPPRIEADTRRVEVLVAGITLADTKRCFRVLETGSPPTFYLSPQDVRTEYLRPCASSSVCEWKGQASYWSIYVDATLIMECAAWSYPTPYKGFEPIAGYLSFYPAKVECYVMGDRVMAQPGDFYGGWVTPEVIGPFKGLPGTEAW